MLLACFKLRLLSQACRLLRMRTRNRQADPMETLKYIPDRHQGYDWHETGAHLRSKRHTRRQIQPLPIALW